MTANLEELITLNYELEGLLYLALHRGEDTPPQVWAMIAEKIEALRTGIPAERMEQSFPGIDETIQEPIQEAKEDDDAAAVEEKCNVAEEPEPAHAAPGLTDIEAKESVSTPASGLRLGEILALRNSRDLRKAISLNDRFRFRRELFGNSDEAMDRALNEVEAMHTPEDARTYFIDRLGLDPKSPDVADFMAIIINHISSK